MDLNFELKYHTLEERHWWSVARREMIFFLLKNDPKNCSILEVGCAGGSLLNFFKQQGFLHLTGIDISEKAIEVCKSKGIQNVKVAPAENTGFNDAQFDVIIASDILEHVQRDQDALHEWLRILKRGGKLILFVPAFKFLWSDHDEVNRHLRRYSKTELALLIEKTGFQLLRTSYWNCLLFFPTLIYRSFQRIFSKSKGELRDQFIPLGRFLNSILRNLVRIENILLKTGINFPIGVSLFCVAKK